MASTATSPTTPHGHGISVNSNNTPWGSASFDLFDQSLDTEAHQSTTTVVGSSSSTAPKNISLAQLRPFLDIAIPFFREDRAAFYALIGIVVLTLIKSALRIGFSFVRRDIFDALNHRDVGKFWTMVGVYFAVLVMVVPIIVLYHYLRAKLALYWRKELTKRVLDKYYANRTYYIIECCKDIDNPDQRISEDLREFTSTSLDFFFIIFDAAINLLSFSAVLFQVCHHNLTLPNLQLTELYLPLALFYPTRSTPCSSWPSSCIPFWAPTSLPNWAAH